MEKTIFELHSWTKDILDELGEEHLCDITDNGETVAILISPSAYKKLDAAWTLQQIRAGNFVKTTIPERREYQREKS